MQMQTSTFDLHKNGQHESRGLNGERRMSGKHRVVIDLNGTWDFVADLDPK